MRWTDADRADTELRIVTPMFFKNSRKAEVTFDREAAEAKAARAAQRQFALLDGELR